MDLVKLNLLNVICPACGQQVEAVARDGRVKGYCTIARQHVDFLIEKQSITGNKAEMSTGLTPMRADRDSKGHFIKGNVPWNRTPESTRREITFVCKWCGKPTPVEEMRAAMTFFPPLIICRECWESL